ncbi:hypothetical protein OG401_23950 [Kitasatospora purpeofusca]|uniref:hypothetical protein n=1 Tax=Kitasatospora purpeofusca TaxID=67352 RepID=UPI002256AB5B|nr:hypothetical protein [Kitasatospora purpeofusca]MCX4687318.1 hypothetical protein [Kitasatospora purpeofusca]
MTYTLANGDVVTVTRVEAEFDCHLTRGGESVATVRIGYAAMRAMVNEIEREF